VIFAAQLRRLSAFLIAIVLFLGFLCTGNTQFGAIAAPLTPEAVAYEVGQAASPQSARSNPDQKNKGYGKEIREDSSSTSQAPQKATDTKNALERAADNVRDKLNLDEPLPQSTKDFLNDIKP
jgi:hypothetical protein